MFSICPHIVWGHTSLSPASVHTIIDSLLLSPRHTVWGSMFSLISHTVWTTVPHICTLYVSTFVWTSIFLSPASVHRMPYYPSLQYTSELGPNVSVSKSIRILDTYFRECIRIRILCGNIKSIRIRIRILWNWKKSIRIRIRILLKSIQINGFPVDTGGSFF